MAGNHYKSVLYGDFDYLIWNESSFFAPFSFNQRPDPLRPPSQYFISSYPSANWNAESIINRVLIHWDTETGTFGTKDHHFSEDKVRYKSIQGAKSHVIMLNSVCNLFWAPAFENYWNNMPISYRMQFLKDHPEYNPFQINNTD